MRSNTFLAAVVLFTLGLVNPSVAEKIYKWTDEGGRTHYSQQNPPNQTATVIDPDEAISVMEGLTPDMEKRLKELEKRQQKEQAASAREAKKIQGKREKKPRIRKVENPETDRKQSFGGHRER
jgi:hypothetical protein